MDLWLGVRVLNQAPAGRRAPRRFAEEGVRASARRGRACSCPPQIRGLGVQVPPGAPLHPLKPQDGIIEVSVAYN